MAARRLVSPDQTPAVRLILGLYEFLASLRFAVVLIALLAVVLGLGTFVESGYGTEAVKFGVWNTWWFTLLNALLAVSIFCAAAIRYPWKRHQTGFVITHIGLLVLLAGCLMSQRGGVDAQIPLLEGEQGSKAYEDSHHFVLEVTPGGGRSPVTIEPIEFRSGPFNWREYQGERWWLPWGLAPRDTGVVHDADGIRLEVLDFYADSFDALAPSVKLRVGSDSFAGAGERGVWMPAELSWQPDPLRATQMRHRASVGGGTIVFWKTGSRAEAEAFLAGLPDPQLGYGERGQLVLVADGKTHRLKIDDVLGKERFPLEGSDLFVEVTDFEPKLAAARMKVRRGAEGRDEEMVVLADLPEVTIHAPRSAVWGTLWIERATADAAERMQGKAKSRIDIVQAGSGGSHELLYRVWQQPAAFGGRLPADSSPVPAFAMPMGKLELRVDRFLPADTLEVATLPLPFSKDKPPSAKRRAARVRLTVDGHAEEFWLAGLPIQPAQASMGPPRTTERRTVEGRSRSVAVMLVPDAIDIGFDVKLGNFERRLDPGTSQASHFSSVVEFLAKSGSPLVKRPVTITMNAPVDFSDPDTGRSYRLFQESFMGPWLPGDELFEQFTKGWKERPDRLEASVLTVNYDPGRGVKYLGSGLIVIGIFTMFYMRAYFFAPRRQPGGA
ncbi:MAG: hypothetical protein ACKOB1_05215 [Planctomycetia bacterium]